MKASKAQSARAAAALEQMAGGPPPHFVQPVDYAAPGDSAYTPPSPKRASPFAWGFGLVFGAVAAILLIVAGIVAVPIIIGAMESSRKEKARQAEIAVLAQAAAQKQKELDKTAANEPDSAGMTPLHHAARLGKIDEIKKLLAMGAEVDARSKLKWTPLHLAAWHGQAEAAEALIAAGADVNASGDRGRTPLVMARSFGTARVAAVLEKHGGK